jgi:hypothetical protein
VRATACSFSARPTTDLADQLLDERLAIRRVAGAPGGALTESSSVPRDTDIVAAEFTCTHCTAVPERVVDGKATIAIVRHRLGCPTLVAQTRTRWPAQVLV